jgi:hypothetical protein
VKCHGDRELTVERQSSASQFAPHARQMPAILVITKEAAEMQPDAIEATQLDRNSGVACGLKFLIDRHALFLLLLTKLKGLPYGEWD